MVPKQLLLIIVCLLLWRCNKVTEIVHPPEGDALFGTTELNPTAVVDHLYSDTIHLVSPYENCKLSVVSTPPCSSFRLQDSILSWTPTVSDTGPISISIQAINNEKVVGTLSRTILVSGDWPTGCATYVHQRDVRIGDAALLPAGYFIYNPYTETGVYASSVQSFDPYLIPNTSSDRPGNLSISDDGQWILYVDMSRKRIVLITQGGCMKTIVPVADCESGFPTIAGFYRQSPFHTEVFYLASTKLLKSVSVEFRSSGPVFSNDRVLANLSDKYHFNPDEFMQIAVVKDQVFSEISPIVNGNVISRTGYLTIPEGGKGIGGPLDVYQWLNDPLRIVDGCGHTQSHDGMLCLANAGGAVGSAQCVPHDHKGFYISRFRRVSDPPIDMSTEHIDKYAISVNWCPLPYQQSSGFDVDFWGWYFGNRNEYVIGRQLGALNENGIWMVDWQKNIWYRLSPLKLNIQALQPAVYFFNDTLAKSKIGLCAEDTTEKPLPYNPNADFFNPQYRIIKPNGGEIFSIGAQCSVFVTARRRGNAVLYLSTNGGFSWNKVPGLNRSINPLADSIITFSIPDSIFNGTVNVSTISSKCKFLIRDYGNANYKDASDSFFSIISPP